MSNALMRCQVEKVLAWLPDQGPDVWHAVATGWNWDVDTAPLRWIIQQDGCDAATAQYVYWTARLGDGADLEELQFIIAQRWAASAYSTSRFSVKGQITISGWEGVSTSLATPIDGPERVASTITLDEGVPRHLLIECFADCGLPLPAWLKPKPKDSERDELDRLMAEIMAEGIEDESARHAMWANPLLLKDLKRWRTYVDTEHFQRLSAQARKMQKEAKAANDPALMQRGAEVRERAYGYMTRMQRPFDIALYPDYPQPQKRGPIARIFGRKPPTNL
jgi:hypothetical protein